MKFATTKCLARIACGLMLGTSAASAAKPITDFPKALAKAQGKPIFIYVFDSI